MAADRTAEAAVSVAAGAVANTQGLGRALL